MEVDIRYTHCILIDRKQGDTMSKKFLETAFEIKGIEDSGSFVGYAAVFDNVDSHDDIIQKGATVKSIAKSKGVFPILADHWGDNHIGYNESAVEDIIGLKVEGQLNLDVRAAKERYSLAKQAHNLGAPFGLSIGYYAKDSSYEHETGIRTLLEIDIKEYSFVPFPSNTRAAVLSIKSLMDDIGDFKGVKKDPKILERIFREVGFSNSESKKLSTTACKFGNTTVLSGDSLREVDDNEVEDTLTAMKMLNMNTILELK